MEFKKNKKKNYMQILRCQIQVSWNLVSEMLTGWAELMAVSVLWALCCRPSTCPSNAPKGWQLLAPHWMKRMWGSGGLNIMALLIHPSTRFKWQGTFMNVFWPDSSQRMNFHWCCFETLRLTQIISLTCMTQEINRVIQSVQSLKLSI